MYIYIYIDNILKRYMLNSMSVRRTRAFFYYIHKKEKKIFFLIKQGDEIDHIADQE